MRTVTKENLIVQIDRLRKIKDEQGQLSMSGEYTLQAYEMLLATMEAEPVENHIGSKNALDAIISFIKSKSNPTVKCYEEVSEQLFKDNCHGIHSHVVEYILKLGEELEDLRAEQAETQPAPVVNEDLYKLANHIASSKNGLPDEWQDWAEELETDIRRATMLNQK